LQRSAVCGLFSTLWTSLANSKRYEEWMESAQNHPEQRLQMNMAGQNTAWITFLTPWHISWQVTFYDRRLGGWFYSAAFPGFVTSHLMRYDSDDVYVREPHRIVLLDITFTAMFETLRQACGEYVQHYRLSVDRRKLPLIGDLLDP
jgi:hypothetical protein